MYKLVYYLFIKIYYTTLATSPESHNLAQLHGLSTYEKFLNNRVQWQLYFTKCC